MILWTWNTWEKNIFWLSQNENIHPKENWKFVIFKIFEIWPTNFKLNFLSFKKAKDA